ncbi:thioredoxin domain-containing protein [Ancylomarina sp. DW003]|nr:thioredoxin domain-containing protein [Ancylomarina sp. DW003]MDE5423912.1 thioredoxin domain-containing protein [Ancylomarina sp. DW003]
MNKSYVYKGIMLLLFAISSCLSVSAQGVNFGSDLDKALVLAKKENKLVFVDFYTSWCGPCKMLSKKVFPQEKVGSYFNSHFINCKIQCDDSGYGKELGEKYEIQAYPTLMLIDCNGEIVHSMAGAPDADGLIEFVKQGMNPEKNLKAVIKRYEDGNRDKEFVDYYFNFLLESRRNARAKTDFTSYFKTLCKADKISSLVFNLSDKLSMEVDTEVFGYIEGKRKKYAKVMGEKEVHDYIKRSYKKQLLNNYNSNKQKYESDKEVFMKKAYSFGDEVCDYVDIYGLIYSDVKNKKDLFANRADSFIKKYGNKNVRGFVHTYGNFIWGKDAGIIAIKWIEDALLQDRSIENLKTYSYILVRNLRFDEAIVIQKEMKAIYLKNGVSTESVDQEIKGIEECKIKFS